MPRYPILQVDAFTTSPLGGNPCAVVLDADELTDETMLAVAREMNLSETAFVCKSSTATARVRYFTPAEEIPMAGHPTIATSFGLVSSGRVKLTGEKTFITLQLNVGPIEVEITSSKKEVRLITMTQLKPQFLTKHQPSEVMPLFHLTEDDLLPDAQVQTVSTGTPQLMVPVKGLNALRRARMNVAAYEQYKKSSDFFSPHLFCLSGATPAGRTFARHFGVPPDTLEDPFTGSATGGMAAFLWHYGLLETPIFNAEQGHWMHRPGIANVEVVGPRNDIHAVKVGGSAVLVLQGELIL